MTYQNKFVVAIKVNDKILRENDSNVYIPFGSHYKILLKNLNTIRAQAKIEIDGDDVSGWLVIHPKQTLELERYIKNNLTCGNKFKFIEKTERIEQHRDSKIEDGLVRVIYKFENFDFSAKPWISNLAEYHFPQDVYNPYKLSFNPYQYKAEPPQYSNVVGSVPNGFHERSFQTNAVSINGVDSNVTNFQSNPNYNIGIPQTSCNTEGITVPGEVSNQLFYNCPDFSCRESSSIVLKLVGRVNERTVEKPVTVSFKPKCVTCHKLNKANNKFCSECGTSLFIV